VAAEADADMVELRLDSMTRPDPAAALADRRRPVIVTCRPLREGGLFEGSEEERLRILVSAQSLGADFVDVEWDARSEALLAERRGRGVVVSQHVFDGTPHDVPARLARLRAIGGEVVKLAVTTERLTDLRTLLGGRTDDGTAILIGMGASGVATRVLPRQFGSRWTYAGPSVAPGQMPVSRLLREYQYRRIRPDAAVYGLIGRPVTDSLSPAMHNAGFAALGMNAVYVPFDTRDLDGLRALGREIGLRGASVTIPFKEALLPLVDEVAPTAAAAGAINTVAIRDGRWIGTNTDADGFIEPLKRRIAQVRGLRAVVLGAGGAARGVAFALRREGAIVTIAARRKDAVLAVAQSVGAGVEDWPPRPGSWDVLVNATPLGGRHAPGLPYEGPFDGRLVYDLVYNPDPTALMQAARAAGCRAIGGVEMLVAQAERQFEIWTGQRPPVDLFKDAAEAALRTRS
jgi:3-dehydroquinate dehydratase/shikimate dehydrogenase